MSTAPKQDPYEHAVYTDVVMDVALSVSALIEVALRDLPPPMRMSVAAAALASAAQHMDGADMTGQYRTPCIMPNGVTAGLTACVQRWLKEDGGQ